jgi:hypothetical protein
MVVPTIDYDTNSILPACGHCSPCVRMVLADRSLWKSARLTYHQFLMATVLMHLEQKRNFGRLIIEVSETIVGFNKCIYLALQFHLCRLH